MTRVAEPPVLGDAVPLHLSLSQSFPTLCVASVKKQAILVLGSNVSLRSSRQQFSNFLFFFFISFEDRKQDKIFEITLKIWLCCGTIFLK